MNLSGKIMTVYNRLEQAGLTNWPVLSAALAHYCLLGLVPLLALCFTVAKSFGLEMALADAINHYAEFASPEIQIYVLARLKSFADNLISNYSGSVMAFVALGLIFWSVYRIMTLLETAFGEIFGFRPPRRAVHRLMDYLAAMIIMPLLLMAAVTINIFFTGLANQSWAMPLGIDPIGLFTMVIIALPYFMWWLVLSWAYAYFSRGLVRWTEALTGGLAASLILQLFQTFYLQIMFDLSSYNAIYGSFAMVPLLLIGLYISWHIVLGGGELTRRFSDLIVTRRGFFQLPDPATWRGTTELASLVMAEITANFQAEPVGRPTSFRRLSSNFKAPMPILGSIVNRLLISGLILRVSGPGLESGPAFLPAGPPEQLTDEQVRKIMGDSDLKIF